MTTRVGNKSAFFYGTLMHPKIFRRVIKNDGEHLKICPAILMNYTRHRVKNEDYPGIISYEKSKKLLKFELQQQERCVRGTLVVGLTAADIRRLDVFEDEGDMYLRKAVQVHALEELMPLSEFVSGELGRDKDLIERIMPTQPGEPVADIIGRLGPEVVVETETYVFLDMGQLEPELWSFGDFLGEKAFQWLYGMRQAYLETEPEPEEGHTRRGTEYYESA